MLLCVIACAFFFFLGYVVRDRMAAKKAKADAVKIAAHFEGYSHMADVSIRREAALLAQKLRAS
jgi:hypothetical protein